jgi:hypothetical protein
MGHYLPNAQLVVVPSAIEEPAQHTLHLRRAIGEFLAGLDSETSSRK